MVRRINDAGISLIKSFEGIRDGNPKTVNLDPYMDGGGVWTIGWGHALKGLGGRLLKGEADRIEAQAMHYGGITMSEAGVLLMADATDAAADVVRWQLQVGQVALSDNQFSALGSWLFNLGWNSKTKNSTLLRKLARGDYQGAADEFPKWKFDDGVVQPGLVRRRAAERELFLTKDGEEVTGEEEERLDYPLNPLRSHWMKSGK